VHFHIPPPPLSPPLPSTFASDYLSAYIHCRCNIPPLRLPFIHLTLTFFLYSLCFLYSFCSDEKNPERLVLLEAEKVPFLFSSADVMAVINITESEKTRMCILEKLGPRLTDPQAMTKEFQNIFRFNVEKEAVVEILKRRTHVIRDACFTPVSLPSPVTGARGQLLAGRGAGRGGAGRGPGTGGTTNHEEMAKASTGGIDFNLSIK
jgi:hypothetical protein